MSYQVLYRRFRPSKFSEVAGQEHITSILKNQIVSGKISHAYLFSGSRGTGKTSTAKIFARAVNCMNPQGGEPCGECEYCLGIKQNNLSDIIEIDAASNRGIDEIRELKDKVNYLPSLGKYRVYIIDEVHMLTTEAFNALLKTLEEPPEHIIFIFATTEPQKILPTILSRCQRFDFARLTQQTIADTLRSSIAQLGISAEDSALFLIAANSDGAMRDAFSFADKAINLSDGKLLTLSDVQNALGLADGADLYRMAEALVHEDVASVFELLNSIIAKGSDISQITNQLIEYFRGLMIYCNTPNPAAILGANEPLLQSLEQCGKNIPAICLSVMFPFCPE
jgi:DNA polymerase-3 subunit gamma/tau